MLRSTMRKMPCHSKRSMSGAKKHNNDAAEMLCEIKQTSNLYSVCGPNLTRPESDMEEIWLMLDIWKHLSWTKSFQQDSDWKQNWLRNQWVTSNIQHYYKTCIIIQTWMNIGSNSQCTKLIYNKSQKAVKKCDLTKYKKCLLVCQYRNWLSEIDLPW